MSQQSLGDILYRIVMSARWAVFDQGRVAQLTYGAFDVVSRNVAHITSPTISIPIPVGLNPDGSVMTSVTNFGKQDLLDRYRELAFQHMPSSGISQLVTIMEALLADILRAVVMRYPQKISGKRTLPLSVVLEANSIEEIHLKATDTLLNDLSYKSPREFADAFNSLISLNLLECPAFHRYIEAKATRDIYVHNRGIVNETYLKRAASHARASLGKRLPIDVRYFLESYEACLQVTEWLEDNLDQNWHSTERAAERARRAEPSMSQLAAGAMKHLFEQTHGSSEDESDGAGAAES